MFKGLFFVLMSICIKDSACVMDIFFETGQEIEKLYTIMDEITFNDTSTFYDVNALLFGYNVKNQEMQIKLRNIHERFHEIERFMNPKIIRDSFKLLPDDILISMCMDKIEMSILSIDEYYKIFYKYSDETSRGAVTRLYDFLKESVVDIQGHIEMIREILFDAEKLLPKHENLISAITNHASAQHNELCNGPQLISDILVQLFRMAIIAELKFTFISGITSLYLYPTQGRWKILNKYNIGQFERLLKRNIHLFIRNLEVTDAMYLRACDPNGGKWIRGESFYELHKAIQTTIFRYHWGVCKYGSCNDIQFKLPNRCEATMYDGRTGCSQVVTQCTYLNAIKACVLKTGPYRFQYVNSSELGSLGRNFRCPKNNGYMIEDGTGLDVVYSACACNCYSNENKINLLIMESKVRANKVITGLRFIRKNKILYIQPREGKLESNGYIFRHSQSWISFPATHNSSQIRSIDRSNSVFFLDDVRLPPYFALTGVKFNEVTRGNITGFAIEVFGLPFDYKSGKLDTRTGSRTSKRVPSDVSGRDLTFERTSSLYTKLSHSPSTMEKMFITLKRSKLSDDFGQATLPLFDAVPITMTPPTVLSGFGIFHKGVEGYAGFLSLRLYGIKYAQYFINFTNHHITDKQSLFNHSN